MRSIFVACLALVLHTTARSETQFEAELSAQWLHYTDAPQADQQQNFLSGIIQPQLFWLSESGDDQLVAQLFYLYDTVDEERRHFDIRELYWLHQTDAWETQVGVGKVFWGVVESRNIVNIINQQDSAYGLNKAYKLGQPLVRATFDAGEFGTTSLFILPYFRAQTQVGDKSPAFITNAEPLYQNDESAQHIDVALRYNHFIDEHEFALSYFIGTDRTPIYITRDNELHPFYRHMQQVGFEYQLSSAGWLWKLEAIHKSIKQADAFAAVVGGFEYSFVGVYQDIDLGLLAELNWDERGTDSNELLQNDTFFATRFALNDVDGSELLLGASIDNQFLSQAWTITGSRRFGESWKAIVSGFLFNLAQDDPLAKQLNNRSSFELQISYFL